MLTLVIYLMKAIPYYRQHYKSMSTDGNHGILCYRAIQPGSPCGYYYAPN